MILYVEGDIFQSPAQVLVNTVNTMGVMGKGIAADFKKMFPEMFVEYRQLCEDGRFDVGSLWLYKTPNKWILNFPTKRHWRQPSKVEYIEAGLKKFANTYHKMGIHSIAFPPLGCGNGQLDFRTQVQPLMEEYLRNLPIEAFIYPDRGVDFVEHQNVDEMRRWLRTEPQSLPFAEVWDDIRRLLEKQSVFETAAKKSRFVVRFHESPPQIEVNSGKHEYFIPYEVLMSLWQQLRSHGFSMRHTAPGLSRNISYIIPVFSALDYVRPVYVADRYDNLHSARVIGLQVLPSAFEKRNVILKQYDQLTLL